MDQTDTKNLKNTILGKTEQQVRAVLEQANPNSLRLSLYQATRDPELVSMKVEQQPYWGGAFDIAGLSPKDAERVLEKAFAFLRDGAKENAPVPSDKELREMMGLYSGKPVSDVTYTHGRGGMTEGDELWFAPAWTQEPSDEVKKKFHVVIIGAGFGGLMAGILLERLGIPYTILERQGGVGGTWWANNYPDARVDVPSHSYQYSFMKKYPWKHWFATGEELQDYARTVVERYKLGKNIQFNTELTAAKWDEASAKWKLKTRGADRKDKHLTANVLISASGTYNEPKLPSIPGLESFRGTMFHTTQWNHNYDYVGKRVAQIGVGSSGAQLMPRIAETAAHLTVYQRTAQWVTKLDGYRDPVPEDMQWLFDHFPHYWSWYCFSLTLVYAGDAWEQGLDHFDGEWQKAGGLVSKRNDALYNYNKAFVQSQVGHDPELVEKLTPNYPPFGRRPVADNGWYDTLMRDNVDLVTEPIKRITPTGVLTEDGIEVEFDFIILCTGFEVQNYLWPVLYVGKNGISLEQFWEKDGARAYASMVMPGFPNMFMLYGPNGQARGSCIPKWHETWASYAIKAIINLIESGHSAMDIKKEVFDEHNAKMDEEFSKQKWVFESTQSYYQNKHGRYTIHQPWSAATYFDFVREPKMEDYDLIGPV